MARGRKGHTNNPNGRPKGVPNKTTKEIREAFQMLIESSLPDIQNWLKDVAKENPEKALIIVEKYADFILPKLQRQEISGGDGNNLKKIVFDFGDTDKGYSADDKTTGDN